MVQHFTTLDTVPIKDTINYGNNGADRHYL